jgi:predicted metal-dependent TIM-barrel fold hydrolase
MDTDEHGLSDAWMVMRVGILRVKIRKVTRAADVYRRMGPKHREAYLRKLVEFEALRKELAAAMGLGVRSRELVA